MLVLLIWPGQDLYSPEQDKDLVFFCQQKSENISATHTKIEFASRGPDNFLSELIPIENWGKKKNGRVASQFIFIEENVSPSYHLQLSYTRYMKSEYKSPGPAILIAIVFSIYT